MASPSNNLCCELYDSVVCELLRGQIQGEYLLVQLMQMFTSLLHSLFRSQILGPQIGPHHDSQFSLAALVRDFDLSLDDVVRMCPGKLRLSDFAVADVLECSDIRERGSRADIRGGDAKGAEWLR